MNPSSDLRVDTVWKNKATGAALHWIKCLCWGVLCLALLIVAFELLGEVPAIVVALILGGAGTCGGFCIRHLSAAGRSGTEKASFDAEGVTFRTLKNDPNPVRVTWANLDRIITAEDGTIGLMDKDDNVLAKFDSYDFDRHEDLAAQIAERSGKRYNRMPTALLG